MNLTLRHALACAKIGWHVFPCLPGDKRPNGFLVKRGVKDASKDPVKLTRWFDRFPEQNIGLACGPSGLVVIDVDTRAGGLLEFEDLLRQGAFPRTPKALTGGGGFHFFFRATSIPLKNGPLRGHRGIDVKTDGGYVVIAPSLHASGRRYEWDPNARPSATPVADLPDWLFQILQPTPTPVPIPPTHTMEPNNLTRACQRPPLDRASRYLARCEPSVQGQRGSVACLKASLALVQGFDLSDDDAYYLLATEFNPRCTPPWSERELRRKVKEAGRLAPAKGHARGWLADKPLEKRRVG